MDFFQVGGGGGATFLAESHIFAWELRIKSNQLTPKKGRGGNAPTLCMSLVRVLHYITLLRYLHSEDLL